MLQVNTPVGAAAHMGPGAAQRHTAQQQNLRHGCGRLRALLPCAELCVRARALVLRGAPGLGAPAREPRSHPRHPGRHPGGVILHTPISHKAGSVRMKS